MSETLDLTTPSTNNESKSMSKEQEQGTSVPANGGQEQGTRARRDGRLRARIRLGCALPYPEDGCSYHRGIGPLAAMASDSRLYGNGRPELELVSPRKTEKGWLLTWEWLANCDALFMQRPAIAAYLQLAKLAKAMGKPLWIDWDDDYTCIPVSNPCFTEYDAEAMPRMLREFAWLADVITVATPELGRRIPVSQRSKIRLVPNACMPVYQATSVAATGGRRSARASAGGLNGEYMPWFNEPRTRRISWRGTDTHDEDLATILPAIRDLAHDPRYEKWFWHFSGGMPWEAHEAVPKERLEMSPFTGPVFFVPLLAAFAPYVHLAPLKRNAFNLCKSNLAWLEATCAGAVVLAPDWEEWQRPGVINYKDAEEFRRTLVAVMESFDGEMHPNVARAREYIGQHLTLKQMNERRWVILEELVRA